MARNQAIKEITVMLDRPRTLRFDANAMEVLEELTGKSIVRGEFKGNTVRDVRAFFTACLRWDDPEITPEYVGSYLDVSQFSEALTIMLRLMTNTEMDPNILAPYVPTPREVVAEALALARVAAGDTLVDLGSGDGRVLAMASPRCAKVIGVEMDAGRVKVSRALLSQLGAMNALVRQEKIQDTDLSTADVVFVYLLTPSNVRIAEKLEKEMKAGARVVSHDFVFPNWAGKSVAVSVPGDDRQHYLHCYTMGEHKMPEIVMPDVETAVATESLGGKDEGPPELTEAEVAKMVTEALAEILPDTASRA